jgi:hypothetical protein
MVIQDSNNSNSQQSIPYLGSLSALAARSFASTSELVDAILSLISDQLGLRTSFLTNITVTENRNRVVAAYNRPGGCGIVADSDLPLEDTF